AVGQRAIAGDRLVVDVGAVARLLVAYEEAAPFDQDFGVVARHLAAGEPQIVGFAAADPEAVFADRNDAPAEGVRHLQTCVWHAGQSLSNAARPRLGQRRRTMRTSSSTMATAIATPAAMLYSRPGGSTVWPACPRKRPSS